MQTLPEIANGNYDAMAQQRNMASLFGDRDAAVQQMQEQVRGNLLAEGNLGNALSTSQLGYATNTGKLASLPQELEIAQSNRQSTQDFQFYKELKRAYHDQALPPEAKKYVIDNLVDQNAAKKSRPGGLADIGSTGEGRNHGMVAEELKRMYANSPDAFIANIDKLLDTTSSTQESMQTRIGQREKDDAALKQKLAEGRFAPERGSGSGERLASDIRKYIDDQRKVVYGDASLKAKLSSLGFLLDDMGNMKQDPDKSPNANHKSQADELRAAAAKEFARRSENARIRYYELTGIKPDEFVQPTTGAVGTTTATSTPAPSNRKPLGSFGTK